MKTDPSAAPLLRIAMVLTDLREDHELFHLPAPKFGSAQTALLEGMASLPDLEVHAICSIRKRVPAPEKLAPNIYFHNCYVPWWGWLKAGYLPSILHVRRIVRETKAAIIHGQGTERNCAISAIFGGRPAVLTVHGNMRAVARTFGAKWNSFHGITARLESLTLPRAEGIVCLNNYTRSEVGPLARRTWNIPNAVADRFFDLPRVETNVPILFCPASIDLRKNQNAFIRALDTVAAEKSFRVHFAGGMPDTPYATEFKELVAARDWCEYLGVLSGEALDAAYAQAAMIALPSREDNCPMAILEAVAMGIPIAAASVGGIPELVTHGENGVLFDPYSAEDIAAAIRRSLESPERLAEMGRAARDRAEKFHRPRVVAEQHVAVYRSVLDDPRAS